MSRDPIRNELRGLDNWLTREPFNDGSDWGEPDEIEEAMQRLDDLMQEGKSDPVLWLKVKAADRPSAEAGILEAAAADLAEYLDVVEGIAQEIKIAKGGS